MGYLDDLMKGAKRTSNNINSLGAYSPLSGFSNEDELNKNPYQQILSSMPKEYTITPTNPLKSDWLGDRSMFNSSPSSMQIPDGVNIDSTFYNRKDIYDLKQRLKASGVEIPETKKDKPGIITRILDTLSTPGYAVTTALYNALDNNKDTKVLKGLLDGVVGGLTSNSDKYKEGSDLVDLMVGEQKKDAGIGEKVGRFAGGMALDVLLDPTTYLTFGTSALVKGASKKVGQEVTEDAVKSAIKGVNGIGDIGKVGNYLDLDQQAKRITKMINENAVKYRDGLRFDFKVPFTKIAIEKEFISAEKISEIGKALGIQDTVGKALDKSGEFAKGVWNYKKSDDGIRKALENVPESILRKIDTSYDLKKDMKNNPLKASRDIASSEVEKVRLAFGKDKVLEESYKGVKELIQLMRDNNINPEEASSLMEQLQTHNPTKEFDPDAIIKMIQEKYLNKTNIDLDNAVKGAKESEVEMRKRMVELLQGKLVEFDEQTKLKKFFNDNGIDVSDLTLDERKKLAKEVEKSKLPTFEELGLGTKTVDDVLKENDVTAKWKLYTDNETAPIIENIKNYLGKEDIDMDEFLSFDTKQQKQIIEQEYRRKLREAFPDGKITYDEFADLSEKEIDKIVNDYHKLSKNNKLTTDELNNLIEEQISKKKLDGKDFRFVDGKYKKIKQNDETLNKINSINEEIKSLNNELYSLDITNGVDNFLKIKRANEAKIAELKKEAIKLSREVEYIDLTKDEIKELSKNRKIKKVSSKDFTKEQINSIIEEGLGNGSLKDLELIDGNYKRKVKKKDTEAYKKYSKLSKEKSDLITSMYGLSDDNYATTGYAKLQRALKSFNKDYNIKETYEIARTTDDVMKKIDDIGSNELKRANEINFNLSNSKKDIEKQVKEYVDEMFKGNTKEKLGKSKEEMTKLYTDSLMEEAKNGVKETTLVKAINEKRNQIGMNVEQMKALKDQVLSELGLKNVKGADDLYDKIVEQRAINMLDYSSKYYISPFEAVTPAKMKRELNNVWNGIKNKEGKKVSEGLVDIVKKYGDEEIDNLYDGTSSLLEGNFAKILGTKSKLNADTVSRLRSEAIQRAKDILYGSGIESDMGSAFDSVIKVIDTKKAKPEIMRIDEIPRKKGQKAYTKETLPKNYKIVSDEGIIQKLESAINKEFGELKGKKFYDLTKEEQNKLLSDVDNLVNKILDNTDHLGGNKLDYLDMKDSRLDYIKNSEEEWQKRGVDNGKDGRNLVINTKGWTEKGQTVNLTKVLDEAPTRKFSSQTRDDKIKALQEEYTRARQRYIINSMHNTAEMEFGINKSLPDGIKMEKIVGNEGNVQKVMDNVNNRNIGKMNVKELRQMLTDAGVKGISNAKREKLVEIANLINSKNIRASIDLTKKTPEEMQTLLRNLGIKDEQFNEAVKRFTGHKANVEKYQATKDSIQGVWNDKNIEKFTNTMEYLYGNGFVEKWNHDIDVLKTKKENFVKTGMVAKSPIELIADNKEIIDALGGGEGAEEFVQKYVKLMSEFGQDEISWGIFVGDENLIKSQGYVARRMSDETREILNADVDKNNFLEAWFKDRANLIVDDPKFAKHRIDGFDGKKTIAEINEAIYEATKKKFGEDGAIKNFFEKDLSRILIQRAYEHGNAFYDKNLQSMYLDKMGVKLSWARSSKGEAYNIVENVNGAKWVKTLEDGITLNEVQTLIKTKNYKALRKEINSFSPNISYLPDSKLQKVIDNANESLDRLENYLKAGAPNKKKLKELTNDVYRNMPQRGFARELKAEVKNGNIKLIYPQGQNRDITLSALKETGIDKMLNKNMDSGSVAKDFTNLTWEDFEKIKTTTNEVPVYAVDRTTYEAYQKAMNKQIVKDTDNFIKLYDKVTGVWKKMATTSVGFHTRNAFGNVMQMYLDVGSEALNPKWLKVAYEVGKDSAEVLFTTPDGVEYTGKMINNLFKEVGLDDATQLTQEFNQARKGKKTIEELLDTTVKSDYAKAIEGKNPIEKIFATSQYFGDNIEQLAKRQQFSILLSKGYDPLEAKRHVDKFLFDYNDLTDFETDFMKRIIPFYTFMRKNAELQFNTLLNNPTPVKTVRRILDNQRKAMLSTDERQLISENDNDKIITEIGGKKRTISTNLPWLEDVNLLGSLNPIIKTPMELATNKNFTFGNDIATYEGQVKEASLLEGLIGGVLGQTEIGADGNKYINAKAKHLITNALPSVRTVDRSLANVTADDKLGGLMALLGLGGQEFNVDKRTSQQVREYKELLENLEKKEQSKGIDTRKKLKEQQELQRILSSLGL